MTICFNFLLFIATPITDFLPIDEMLVFMNGQGQGDSVCTDIVIISDSFVEVIEVFEVMLFPYPMDRLVAFIQAGKDRALVRISDRQDQGMFVAVNDSK